MHVEIRRARVPLHRAAAIQRADAAKCWRGSGEMEGILVIGGIWSGRATYWILPSTSASRMNWHFLLFVSESANKRQIVYLPLLHGPWKAALIHHLALPHQSYPHLHPLLLRECYVNVPICHLVLTLTPFSPPTSSPLLLWQYYHILCYIGYILLLPCIITY